MVSMEGVDLPCGVRRQKGVVSLTTPYVREAERFCDETA